MKLELYPPVCQCVEISLQLTGVSADLRKIDISGYFRPPLLTIEVSRRRPLCLTVFFQKLFISWTNRLARLRRRDEPLFPGRSAWRLWLPEHAPPRPCPERKRC